jgi:hypothetical protein
VTSANEDLDSFVDAQAKLEDNELLMGEDRDSEFGKWLSKMRFRMTDFSDSFQ